MEFDFDDGLDCYSMEVLLLHMRTKHIRAKMLNSNKYTRIMAIGTESD